MIAAVASATGDDRGSREQLSELLYAALFGALLAAFSRHRDRKRLERDIVPLYEPADRERTHASLPAL